MNKFLLMFLFLTNKFCHADCGDWYRSFRPWTGVYENSSCMDTSGNIYILSTRNYGYGVEIRKYDNCGIIQWIDTFNAPDPIASGSFGSIIKIAPSGNLYAMGSGANQTRLMKYSPSGYLIWYTDFLMSQPINMYFSDDENIYVGGITYSNDTIRNVKLDSSGNLIRNNIIYTRVNIVRDYLTGIDQEQVFLYRDSLSTLYLTSFDSTGNNIFTKPAYNTQFGGFIKRDNSGRIIIYSLHDTIFVCDRNGAHGYLKKINSQWIINIICDSHNNLYLIAQDIVQTFSSWQLIKLDSSFNEIWRRNFNASSPANEAYFRELNLGGDQSIYMTGVEKIGSVPNNSSCLLTIIELDSNGVEKRRLLHYTAGAYALRTSYTFIDKNKNVTVSQGVGYVHPEYLHTVHFCYACEPDIMGNIFHDVNNDCVKDTTENYLQNSMVILLPDSFYATTDANGIYKFDRPFGSYQVDYILSKHWKKVCPQNAYSIVLDSIQPFSYQNNFAVDDTDNINDLSVSISLSPVSPGMNMLTTILVKNEGTTSLPPLLKLNVDSNLNLISSGMPPDSVINNTLIWELDTLKPGDYTTFNLVFKADSSTAISTVIREIAQVEPLVGDYEPSNNLDSAFEVASGAFDPNSKEVSPEGYGINHIISQSDSILKYIIHFQNTGNDTAFMVMIKDTIDPLFDLGSFEMTASSHPYTYSVNGRTITWNFNNINLPDSGINFLRSQGFISYKVKLKKSIQNGSTISNRAHIYFDYNIPITTNMVENTFMSSINVAEINTKKLFLFPNPSTGMIYYTTPNEKIERILVTDLRGSKISAKITNYSSIEIERNGFYIISFYFDDKTIFQSKIVVFGREY